MRSLAMNGSSDTAFAAPLRELHKLAIENEYENVEDMDFEPYSEFLPKEQALEFFRLWTDHKKTEPHALHIFGQDGSGGFVMFWSRNDGEDILQQPVVFLGSEGEKRVIAQRLRGLCLALGARFRPA